MITIKEFPDKTFSAHEEAMKFLIENKETIIAQKKAMIKFTDSFSFLPSFYSDENYSVTKERADEENDVNKLRLKLVINTCGVLDSHGDVHINGSWNKTARENKNLLLLQEHKATFSHIISDDVKAKVERFNWTDLGLNAKGETEALVFYANVVKERNPYMFEQYQKGFVKQHSVGMYYVKIALCCNNDDEWAKEEKENWDKYIDQIVNKKDAEERKYFWAVLEAKAVEGSAVVFGSNPITPTLQVTESNKTEPSNHSDTDKNEPSKDTQKEEKKGIKIVKLKKK